VLDPSAGCPVGIADQLVWIGANEAQATGRFRASTVTAAPDRRRTLPGAGCPRRLDRDLTVILGHLR